MNQNRKLSNIRLTRKFHLRYLGLWVLISVMLVTLLNVVLYLLMMQMWGYAADFPGETSLFQRAAAAGLAIEGVLFAFALVMLARATSHRIAGPYLNLERTCKRIAAGEREVRIRFRNYDGLDDTQKAFNDMVDALCRGK